MQGMWRESVRLGPGRPRAGLVRSHRALVPLLRAAAAAAGAACTHGLLRCEDRAVRNMPHIRHDATPAAASRLWPCAVQDWHRYDDLQLRPRGGLT